MTSPAQQHRADTGARHRCDHGAAARPVDPCSTGCLQCQQHGEGWVELWLCLSCGWVACCDNSPNQHARAHYQETDHPVAGALWGGPRPGWCYVHERTVSWKSR